MNIHQKEDLCFFFKAERFTEEIDFSKEKAILCEKRPEHLAPDWILEEYLFINNPDGSIRWIIPQTAKRPLFLNLFCTAGKRAQTIAFIWASIYRFSLEGKLNSGKFYLAKPKRIQSSPYIKSEKFALFLGTTGPNQKLICYSEDGAQKYIYKIARTEKAKQLIQKEEKALLSVQVKKDSVFTIPKFDSSAADYLCTTFFEGKKINYTLSWSNTHSKALIEFYNSNPSSSNQQVNAEDYFNKFQIESGSINDDSTITRLEKLLKSCISNLSQDLTIPLSTSHGDFTPWNIISGTNNIYVFDWELKEDNCPLLYDYFHYQFQCGILIKRQSFEEIFKQCLKDIELGNLEDLLEVSPKSFEKQMYFYLLKIGLYYINIYKKQTKLHKQAYWLIDTWAEGLTSLKSKFSVKDTKMGERKAFINYLFATIKDSSYAWLKSKNQQPESIDSKSDIDLLVLKSEVKNLIKTSQSFEGLSSIKVSKLHGLTSLDLFFTDNSFLRLDLIFGCYRKELDFLPIKNIIQKSIFDEKLGAKIPSCATDLEYTFLFHILNYSSVSDKQLDYFSGLDNDVQSELCKFISQKYSLKINSILDLADYSNKKRKVVLNQTKKQPQNNLIQRSFRRLTFIFSNIIHALTSNNHIITFSGVDGAGKSTLLYDLKNHIETIYRKPVVVIRHRPSLFPILSVWKYGPKKAKARAEKLGPHSANPSTGIKAGIRFAYYYLDYLFGQWPVHFYHHLKGRIIIYDRYYYDFIADSERSNIKLNNGWVKKLFRFLKKPSLNFYLFADPNVIVARKPELDVPTIEKLHGTYFKLFNEFSDKYKEVKFMPIENQNYQVCFNSIKQAVHKSFSS